MGKNSKYIYIKKETLKELARKAALYDLIVSQAKDDYCEKVHRQVWQGKV